MDVPGGTDMWLCEFGFFRAHCHVEVKGWMGAFAQGVRAVGSLQSKGGRAKALKADKTHTRASERPARRRIVQK